MPFKLFDCDKEIPERESHCYVMDSSDVDSDITCNVATIPGSLSHRGCVLAGSKGVITGAIKDVVHVIHSPIGCAYYSCGTKRYPSSPVMPDGSVFPVENFNLKYVCTTDLKESDIVFGGMKKLKNSIIEANNEFPFVNAIYVHATCSSGLIGDDIDSICREMSTELGKDVVAFNTPGFAGCSQSNGHKITNSEIFDSLVGNGEPPATTPYDICLIGEYNIDGDMWVIEKYLNEIGINILSRFSGDSSHDQLKYLHRGKLNLVRCQRSATRIAESIKDKFGVDFVNVDFFSPGYCSENLRMLGKHFGLEDKVEMVIDKYYGEVKEELAYYKKKLAGKKVYIFSGGPKSFHLAVPLEKELGMDVTAVSSIFEHDDGYKKIKSRVKDGTMIVDDPNSLELDEMLIEDKPDIVLAGIKEKYLIIKSGIPSVMIHSSENGPYMGYSGFLNLAKDIYNNISSPVWGLLDFKEEV
jgi:nitrogenase molybdenum-iron protein alpha chain